MKTYCAEEVARALGLKGKRMVIELARKHFAGQIPVDERVKSKTPGGYQRTSRMRLTEDQTKFIISRSRGDTALACARLGLKDCSAHSLMRNERLFFAALAAAIAPAQFVLSQQRFVAGFLADAVVESDFAAIVIEYDERGHAYSKAHDAERQGAIASAMQDKGKRVCFVRVEDTTEGFVDGIRRVCELVHGDWLGPVMYAEIDDDALAEAGNVTFYDDGLAAGLHYKEVYKLAKEKVGALVPMIGQGKRLGREGEE